jgi:DNA repair ATPase RecN
MKKRLKIESLVLVGTRKNYTVNFHDGFNLISGHTSTGKTSILEMIDYALGAQSHKSYIEIGNSCSHVELIIVIGDEKFKIRRELFNFKAPVVIEDWREDKTSIFFIIGMR